MALPASEIDEPQISISELIELCATDQELFGRTFFPKTLRQPSPQFHVDVWDALANPLYRYVNIQIFRDGAKTTLLRLFTANRIAYGLSSTILYIGKSEKHALRSVSWIRRAVEYNPRFAQTFGLKPGSKWQDEECEVRNELLDCSAWIIAMGITGSLRGINRDDWRPDLIIIDDVIDDENAATPDQRKKINERIHGAIKDSLAPRSEMPNAMIGMLQTPLNAGDASMMALKDPEWKSLVFPCWTPETLHLPIDLQESAWPDRYPSAELRAAKKAALAANRGHLWFREKECRITSPETADFREGWLKYWELLPERNQMDVVCVIDPVPPPSELQIQKGLHKKDFEVFAVCGRRGNRYFVIEYRAHRGHTPEWTIQQFFEIRRRWRPRSFIVEPINYQRTLAWILKQAMQSRGEYSVIDTKEGTGYFQRKKRDRILDGIQPIASNGQLYIHKSHSEFIDQYINYPDVEHDDVIEAVATAIGALHEDAVLEGEFEVESPDGDKAPPLPKGYFACP